MQETRIYLSDLEDDDLISIQDDFYKIVKLKQVFTSLSGSARYILGAISHQYGSFDLGLSTFDKSYYGNNGSFALHKEFMEDGFNYKFIKLGYPGWQTGLFKLSVKPYLSSVETEIQEKVLVPHYDFSSVNFGDEDMLSFKEDKFCTGETIKNIFQKTFDNDVFYEKCSSIFAQPIPELRDAKTFLKYGEKIRFLRIKTAKWQSAILRISFIFETQINEVQNNKNSSPLDEIRNSSIEFL